MNDTPPLRRQWTLVRLLCARRHGLTVRELARELDTGEKTVRRDLDTLRAVGFPVVEQTEAHGRKRWNIRGENGTPGLTFDLEEAAALYLGRRFLEPLAGTLF